MLLLLRLYYSWGRDKHAKIGSGEADMPPKSHPSHSPKSAAKLPLTLAGLRLLRVPVVVLLSLSSSTISIDAAATYLLPGGHVALSPPYS